MLYYKPKEAAKIVGCAVNTIHQGILRGKKKPGTGIFSIEGEDLYPMVPESEVKRLIKEKEIVKSPEYFSGKDLENMRFDRKILLDGTLPTVMAWGMYFVHYLDFRDYLLKSSSKYSLHPKKLCIQSVIVGSRVGLDILLCNRLCGYCSNYLSQYCTKCSISYGGAEWDYSDSLNEAIGYLFFMEIPFGGKVTVKTNGPKANELKNVVVKAVQ